MKKILLFTENLGSGGAERQLTGLAVLLKQRGYQVKVLTYVEKQFYEAFLRENGVEYELDTSIFNGVTGLLHLYKKVKQYAPETVISFLPAPNRRMCLLRLFYNFNLIVSERSHTQNWGMKTKMTHLLYGLANKIVANSYSEVDNIASHCHWLRSKTLAIPNYVEVDKFFPIEKQSSEMTQLVTVGRLIPSKNALRLLDAMYKLLLKGYKFKLTWVGSQRDPVYLEQIKRKVIEYGLSDNVILKDQTHNVVSEYQSADIFCFPTLYEGYPNVLCEAMSCGLPIICSNVCEMPKIVEEGVNGYLFDPLNLDDMANAMERILNLPIEKRREMGDRNRQKVIKNNTKDIFVEKYIELIG